MENSHVRLLSVMDDVHEIMSGHDDIETMLEALLSRMLDVLGCDRAWLLYPCDPDAPTWSVPMEQTREEWPGAFALNLHIPMDPGLRYVFEAALAANGPVTLDAESEIQVPTEVSEEFGVQAQMMLAVRPKTDRPWMLGIHHCSRAHVFTDEERTLFAGIGRRLGDSLSTLIALRDLRRSEARLEETVRRRTAELQRANEELQAFSYSVSHDLRAPIRAVRGYLDALADDYAADLDQTARMYIDRSLSSCDHMDQIVESLLRLARAARSELRRESIDLSALVATVIASLRAGAPGRKVTVSIEEGLRASADAPLIHAALENLLENAWKYSGQEAETRIEVGAVAGSDVPTFYVRDNGVGFDMKHADRLFQSFERLHGKQFTGTGIGLATVRRIISRHGGRVWARSSVDNGATFYFTLPGQPSGPASGLPLPGGSSQPVARSSARPGAAECPSRARWTG
jgi:signal transduction histidine kinase